MTTRRRFSMARASWSCVAVIWAASLLSSGPAAAQLAFPGAQGFGKEAKGGRNGKIIAVTNLGDSGPGSLRACMQARVPRVCVFRVGGVIRFTTKRPEIRSPYLTIAGQTAPGGGITISHSGGRAGQTPIFIARTHDIVVRNVRVRTDQRGDNRGSNDGFAVWNSKDIVLDHVSASWALDELVDVSGTSDRVTVSWSVFAEGIPRHDKCALLYNAFTPSHVSFLNNLCAHNGDRNPNVNFRPGSCVEIVNNVLYDAGSQFAEVWETYGGTPVNIVGNRFKAGPSTSASAGAIDRQTIASTGTARIFAARNELEGPIRMQTESVDGSLSDAPVCPLTVEPLPAAEAYSEVLARSGAFPRDAVDLRIVDQVRKGAGSIVRTPGTLPGPAEGAAYADSDGDGMSDKWEQANGADPKVADSWKGVDENGFAYLDRFLNDAQQRSLAGKPVE